MIKAVQSETTPELFQKNLEAFAMSIAARKAPPPSRVAFLRHLIATFSLVNARFVLASLFKVTVAKDRIDEAKSLLRDVLTLSKSAGSPVPAATCFKAFNTFGDSEPELVEQLYSIHTSATSISSQRITALLDTM